MLGEEELSKVTLLVFANKQDLPNAVQPDVVVDKLGLKSLGARQWFVQPCCATSGEGLFEGLDWLSKVLTANTTGTS